MEMEAKEYLYENYSTKPDIDHPYKLYWNEDVIHAMNEYAKLKCEQLLCLAAEKARIIEDGDIDNPYEEYSLDLGGSLRVSKESILCCIDLEEFISPKN